MRPRTSLSSSVSVGLPMGLPWLCQEAQTPTATALSAATGPCPGAAMPWCWQSASPLAHLSALCPSHRRAVVLPLPSDGGCLGGAGRALQGP